MNATRPACPPETQNTTTASIPQNPAETQYSQALDALYEQLDAVVTPADKLQLPRPVTGRLGGPMSIWTNFPHLCELIDREPAQVAEYIAQELCTTVSLTEKLELKIRYRLGSEKACQILAKYLNVWVRCHVCRSLHTSLQRATTGRYHVIHCHSCLADHTPSVERQV